MTKPRGPEQPSLPLVRGFRKRVGEMQWLNSFITVEEESKQGILPNSSAQWQQQLKKIRLELIIQCVTNLI